MRAHRLTAFAFIVLGLLIAPAFADGSFVKIGDIKGDVLRTALAARPE